MKKLHKLSDEFDNGEIEHFTHYDYLMQVINNGQPTALKEHVEEIQTRSLLVFFDRAEMTETYREIIRLEIIKRTGDK